MSALLPVIFVVGTLVSAGAKLSAGVAANKAAGAEASLQEEQGRIAREEANEKARTTALERRKFLARQKLAFIKNGVSLEGSPLLVLEETRSESQKQVDAIARRGFARQQLFNRRAAITRRQGRAALVGGIGSAVGGITTSVFVAQTSGIFGGTKEAVDG